MKELEEILKKAGITPTPVRILVYRFLSETDIPISLSDLETALETVDKSTISRTLNLLRERHLLHCFNDGSGAMKYEPCKSNDHEHNDDSHVHFRCEKCGKTICFPSLNIPQVELPEGFEAHESNYVISGVCRNCNR